jgi:hypothetical protein
MYAEPPTMPRIGQAERMVKGYAIFARPHYGECWREHDYSVVVGATIFCDCAIAAQAPLEHPPQHRHVVINVVDDPLHVTTFPNPLIPIVSERVVAQCKLWWLRCGTDVRYCQSSTDEVHQYLDSLRNVSIAR